MRRYIFIFIGAICITCVMAQSVTKELATRVALQYIKNDISNAAPSDFTLLTKNKIDTSYTVAFSPMGKAPLYLVQLPEGWVLVASEFVTSPVLASAPVGQFPDTIDMPDGLKWLLSYYEDAIQYTHDSILTVSDNIQNIWRRAASEPRNIGNRDISSLPESYEIDSIRSFRWNQNRNNGSGSVDCDKVYNKFCPTWFTPSCGHTYVGCTAVAMGLVMRYYKWPYSALIPNTIDSLAHISTEKHVVNYHWDKMPGLIYNSSDDMYVDEVAGFLRDCGYASKMKYKVNGSRASLNNAKNALSQNFHYYNMSYVYRNSYAGDWVNMLQSEIAADRPVIYAGYNYQISNPTGHAFVLYGYTADNKFIIHWGWGNSSANNGAYSLDALTPLGHYYNDYQEAIIGITPQYPLCDTLYLQQINVDDENFEIYRGGPIIAQNININGNQSGVVFSGESVTLTSGCCIEAGAEVYIDIKNMHCDNGRSYYSAPRVAQNHQYPSPPNDTSNSSSARKIVRNGQLLIVRGEEIYTISGVRIQ